MFFNWGRIGSSIGLRDGLGYEGNFGGEEFFFHTNQLTCFKLMHVRSACSL